MAYAGVAVVGVLDSFLSAVDDHPQESAVASPPDSATEVDLGAEAVVVAELGVEAEGPHGAEVVEVGGAAVGGAPPVATPIFPSLLPSSSSPLPRMIPVDGFSPRCHAQS